MKDIQPEKGADKIADVVLTKWTNILHDAFDKKLSDSEFISAISSLLADDVVFKAPTYLKQRKSKEFTAFALLGVTKVFKDFEYTRKILSRRALALEFSCRIGTDGLQMRGIDLISFNDSGKITEIEVLARPPNAVMKLQELQADFLSKSGILKPKL